MAKSAKSSVELTQHPIALQFVPGTMPDEEFDAFVEDIKARGQRVPIVKYQGQILDGWHRYRACLQLGIEPKFGPDYEGDDPINLVIALNVLRRKLGAIQRALAGARLNMEYSITQDEASKRVGVSKVHVSLVVQALNSKNARIIKMLEDTTLTRAALHEEMVDCGIINPSAGALAGAKPAANLTAAAKDGLNGVFHNFQNGASDNDDDLLGTGNDESPQLDDLLGDPPTAGGKVLGNATTGTGSGVPAVGTRPSHPERRNVVTPAGVLADRFKGLSEPDRISFMQLTWHMQRPLLGAAGLSTEAATKTETKNNSTVATKAVLDRVAKASKAPVEAKGKGSKRKVTTPAGEESPL